MWIHISVDRSYDIIQKLASIFVIDMLENVCKNMSCMFTYKYLGIY
jgi:hypothetical protein